VQRISNVGTNVDSIKDAIFVYRKKVLGVIDQCLGGL
jgi:hypothetical protein